MSTSWTTAARRGHPGGMASPVETSTPDLPPLPRWVANPREIRAALHAEYRDEFDRDYREALAEAGRPLELEAVQVLSMA